MAKTYLTHTHTWTQRHKCPLNPLPDPCPGRPPCAPAPALRPGLPRPRLPRGLHHFLGASPGPALLASSRPEPPRWQEGLQALTNFPLVVAEVVARRVSGRTENRAALPTEPQLPQLRPPGLSPPDVPRRHLLTSPVNSQQASLGHPSSLGISQLPGAPLRGSLSSGVYVSRDLIAPN